jgi:hypothetical protein
VIPPWITNLARSVMHPSHGVVRSSACGHPVPLGDLIAITPVDLYKPPAAGPRPVSPPARQMAASIRLSRMESYLTGGCHYPAWLQRPLDVCQLQSGLVCVGDHRNADSGKSAVRSLLMKSSAIVTAPVTKTMSPDIVQPTAERSGLVEIHVARGAHCRSGVRPVSYLSRTLPCLTGAPRPSALDTACGTRRPLSSGPRGENAGNPHAPPRAFPVNDVSCLRSHPGNAPSPEGLERELLFGNAHAQERSGRGHPCSHRCHRGCSRSARRCRR